MTWGFLEGGAKGAALGRVDIAAARERCSNCRTALWIVRAWCSLWIAPTA